MVKLLDWVKRYLGLIIMGGLIIIIGIIIIKACFFHPSWHFPF